ncbi:MAG: hypothetical protein AB8B96_05790 [Lysobacterales bacterium]
MTTKELTSVALKVFAIFISIKAIAMLPLVSSMAVSLGLQADNARGEAFVWFLGIVALLFLLFLTALIWTLSERVVHQIETQPNSQEAQQSVDPAFLLSLLGVYLTVEGLQRFGETMANTLKLLNTDIDLTFPIISSVFLLAVGLSFVVRPSGWNKMLWWFRGAGLKEKL